MYPPAWAALMTASPTTASTRLVRYELAAVRMRGHLAAELAPVEDVVAEQIAARDVAHTEVLGQGRALRALTGARHTERDDSHGPSSQSRSKSDRVHRGQLPTAA
jgi:hypothetical protein